MTLRPLNGVPRGMSFLSKLSAGSAHDLVGADTVGAQQHDLSPPHSFLRGVAIPCECRQSTAISGLRVMEIPVRMRPDLHACNPPEIPPGIRRDI